MSILNVLDFGAVADGVTDCSKAIQSALDEAGKDGGEVVFPSGTYMCADLKVPRAVSLKGSFAWTYGGFGGTILKLNNPDASCVLDITGAFGCRIDGLCIDGDNLGENVNGIMLKWDDRWAGREELGGKEDTPTVSNCRVANFSGNAAHFEKIWCFSIRHSMLGFSENGLYLEGCDGFITDSFFSDNRQHGVVSERGFMSGTFSGNRFECNGGCGVKMHNCGAIQFNGNYWDYNGLTGFYSANNDDFDYRGHLTFVGNIFYRDGWKFDEGCGDTDNSHIKIENACNVIINSNDFMVGNAYRSPGNTPDYCVAFDRLRDSVIKDNVMLCGAYKQNFSKGETKGEVIIKDNVGAPLSQTTAQPFARYED